MGFAADAVNKVKDVLDTEQGAALSYFNEVYFGELDTSTSAVAPYLWLHLASPAFTEEWHATTNSKLSFLKLLIVVVIEAQDLARPYGVSGDATKRGILTATEDVMNRLDANRSVIVAANAALMDFNISILETRNIGERTWECVIEMTLRTRIFSGGR